MSVAAAMMPSTWQQAGNASPSALARLAYYLIRLSDFRLQGLLQQWGLTNLKEQAGLEPKAAMAHGLEVILGPKLVCSAFMAEDPDRSAGRVSALLGGPLRSVQVGKASSRSLQVQLSTG